MKDARHHFLAIALMILAFAASAAAQTCYTSNDMDDATRSAIQTAAQQYMSMVQSGNYAGLKAAAIPALANSFDAVNSVIGEHQKDLKGQAQGTGLFVLDASSAGGVLERAEFYCGIFNSPDRVGFIIPNLPPGKYAFVSGEITGGQTPVSVNFILQQNGGQWQLAGLTIDPQAVGGHDYKWFLQQARTYHQQGANLTGYLYYWMAWKLAAPYAFEYTATRDQIADEMGKAKPADFPSSQSPVVLNAGTKTYRVTSIDPLANGNDLDVIIRYQAASDLNDTAAAFADNTAVMKAALAKYPELRQAFGGINALAVAPNGGNYSTLLAMKDVK